MRARIASPATWLRLGLLFAFFQLAALEHSPRPGLDGQEQVRICAQADATGRDLLPLYPDLPDPVLPAPWTACSPAEPAAVLLGRWILPPAQAADRLGFSGLSPPLPIC
ncbi:MAG: hypothetical protein JXR96_13325 [Deltaproteobacteria bacterium]|nr:hypothetical protein [Deltaproteobacteria bacterium]